MAKCPLGRPPARPLRLLGARLVALGGAHSRGASQATGRPPPPRVLELAAHFPALTLQVQLPILGAWLYSEATDDPPRTGTRKGIDYIIGFWAFASMSMSGYRPRVVGVENLPEGACGSMVK